MQQEPQQQMQKQAPKQEQEERFEQKQQSSVWAAIPSTLSLPPVQSTVSLPLVRSSPSSYDAKEHRRQLTLLGVVDMLDANLDDVAQVFVQRRMVSMPLAKLPTALAPTRIKRDPRFHITRERDQQVLFLPHLSLDDERYVTTVNCYLSWLRTCTEGLPHDVVQFMYHVLRQCFRNCIYCADECERETIIARAAKHCDKSHRSRLEYKEAMGAFVSLRVGTVAARVVVARMLGLVE